MNTFMERLMARATGAEKEEARDWLEEVNLSLEYDLKERLVPLHIPDRLVGKWEMIKEKATKDFKEKLSASVDAAPNSSRGIASFPVKTEDRNIVDILASASFADLQPPKFASRNVPTRTLSVPY